MPPYVHRKPAGQLYYRGPFRDPETGVVRVGYRTLLSQDVETARVEARLIVIASRGLPDNVLRALFYSTLRNAKTRGIDNELTIEHVRAMARRSGGFCEVSGIPFDPTKPAGRGKRRPWAPSIDRIENAFGYTPDNCRLVTCAANFAMNHWGITALDLLARSYVAHNRSRRPAQMA